MSIVQRAIRMDENAVSTVSENAGLVERDVFRIADLAQKKTADLQRHGSQNI